MHQQLWGYKIEEKLYLGVREQNRLNTSALDHCFPNFLAPRPTFRTTIYRDPHSFTGQKKVILKRKKYLYFL
jgi:hypothetical protein